MKLGKAGLVIEVRGLNLARCKVVRKGVQLVNKERMLKRLGQHYKKAVKEIWETARVGKHSV